MNLDHCSLSQTSAASMNAAGLTCAVDSGDPDATRSGAALVLQETGVSEETINISNTNNCNSDVSLSISEDKKTGKNLSKRSLKRLKRWQLKKAEIESKIQSSSWQKKVSLKTDDNGDLTKESVLIDAKCLLETDYYFEHGLRKVYPYYYDFTAHAKGRWFGQKLIDVFVAEFQNNTFEQCKNSIAAGTVLVNGKKTNVDYVLKNGDFITNRVHRHELPVADIGIEIVVDDADVLVVNKPSSMPVHPCGRYRHNSLIYILAKEYGYVNLRGVYRLDRLTSGLLIFGRTESKTAELMKHIRDREVEKQYVCRVDGLFPDGEIVCEEPIGVLSHKLGIFRTTPDGKESKTTFNRLNFNGTTSVVRCRPHTGRTHQIRVHLQYLGYPIVNDSVYNGTVWGPDRGKHGKFGRPDSEILAELIERHSSNHYLDNAALQDNVELQDNVVLHEETVDYENAALQENSTQQDNIIHPDGTEIPINSATKFLQGSQKGVAGKIDVHTVPHSDDDLPKAKRTKLDVVENGNGESKTKHPGLDASRIKYDSNCKECRAKYVELTPDQLVMYLHAFSYKGPGWEYSTELPDWANEDWIAPAYDTS